MNLKISNLAQIKDAHFEESDLVVIVGDNGTGKTLLLETITLIKDYFTRNLDNMIDTYLEENPNCIKVELDWEDLYKYYRASKIEKFNDDKDSSSSLKRFKVEVEIQDTLEVNDYFSYKFKSVTEKITESIKEKVLFTEESNVKYELLDIPEVRDSYEYSSSFIMNDGFGILISDIDNNHKNVVSSIFHIESGEDFNQEDQEDIEPVENYLPTLISAEDFKNKIFKNSQKNFLKLIFRNYFSDGKLLFLPSERNLYMDNALRKTLDQNYNKTKLRYSEFLFNKDYLEFQDLSKRFYKRIFSEELKKLFGGTLSFTDNGEVESLTKTNGHIIRRELFSTKQNRLLPYLIINNPFQNYKEIIIEEPEAHMSLKSMNELLDFIKTLIKKKDKKVYLTTHSDVFFSRVNNFLISNNGISSKVYELKEDGKESFLESKIKTEYGYEIDLFTHELEDLYQQTIELQNENIDKLDEV
ncbi:AAA family ATPase [Metabacillus litoralis]|uniref:AAA family ATPase n=1 Tax=Metabacillus litoralis TaxID=152268 RepID=UPI001CFCEED9|nr:AAA family ATPase [Metabacillus litoralis]